MNRMNEILRGAMTQAIGALFFLDDAGCTVCSIECRSSRPVIRLDRAPARFIQGATRKSYRVGNLREHVMVALVQGCQVEWTTLVVRGEQQAVGGSSWTA